MTLDFPTLNLFMVALLSAAALVFALVAAHYRRRQGLWWWLLGCLALVAGYAVRWWHSSPDPSQAYWLAGSLFVAGNLGFWIGIYQFAGVRQRLSPALVAALLLLTWLAALELSYPRQVALSMWLAAAPNLLAYWLIRRATHLAEPLLRVFVAAVFLVSALVLATRGGLMFLSVEQSWPISPEQLSARGGLVSSALIILRCFALLVLLHAGQEQELRQLAVTDALTGLLNRKGFFDRAGRLLERQAGQPEPVAVLMLDLDHFKQINDQYGHAAGDAVLRQFARLLQQQLRPGDCTGRVGGEEFAAVLPGLGQATALQIAERLRLQLQQHPLTVDGQTLSVTVSIGVHAASAADASLEPLLQQADQALYLAKQNGRNQVAAVPD